jgi:hypothetical protein
MSQGMKGKLCNIKPLLHGPLVKGLNVFKYGWLQVPAIKWYLAADQTAEYISIIRAGRKPEGKLLHKLTCF